MNEGVLESISVPWLVREYQSQLGLDISRLLPPDCRHIELVEDEFGIRQFTPLIEGDEEFYSQLADFSWYYQESKREYHTAARLTIGARVLEVGAGSGAFAQVAKAKEYVGLDTSGRAKELAAERGVDVRRMHLDEYLDTESFAPFDVVCGFQVLEHVADPVGFMRQISAACRVGGWVVLSVPNENSFVSLDSRNILNLPPHHQSRWTDRALESAGTQAGLDTVALVAEEIDELHVEWARAVTLDRLAHNRALRDGEATRRSKALRRVGGLSMPRLDAVIRRTFKGHTITAIYRKSEDSG